jgi:hypothetical protein
MKIKGLSTDRSLYDQPTGFARFAKNAISGNAIDIYENEEGFIKLRDLPTDYLVCGIMTIMDSQIVFAVDGINQSYIYEFKPERNTLEVKVQDSDFSGQLNFSPEHFIQGEYYINSQNERVIAFIDGNNPPRLINIDNPQISNINDTLLFRESSSGLLQSYDVLDTGGSLTTGAYYFTYRYVDNDGSFTNWFIVSKPFYVNDERYNVIINEFDGSPADTPSSKSISLTYAQLDVRYSQIQFTVIEAKAGVLRAYELSPTTNAETVNFIYTGSENKVETSLQTLIVNSVSYSNAKAITQLNRKLYLGNLETSDDFEYQLIANNIRINFKSELRELNPSTPDNNGTLLNPKKGFRHGEVYAFYIAFELKDGTLSKAYHIPGRPPLADERSPASIRGLSGTYPAYKVRDTAQRRSRGATTNMGFWENEGETYPTDFPGLAGENVRHHKFPCLFRDGYENHWGAQNLYTSAMPVLGIEVFNVIIPQELRDKVNNWTIFYAKKSTNNSLVAGYEPVLYSHRRTGGGGTGASDFDTLYFNGLGNWRYAVVTTTGLAGLVSEPTTERARGHCPDLLFQKPSVAPSYIRWHYNLQRNNLSDLRNPFVNFRNPTGSVVENTDNDRRNGLHIIDYFMQDAYVNANTHIVDDKHAAIENFKYIPANTQDGVIYNVGGEEIINFDIRSPIPDMQFNDARFTAIGNNTSQSVGVSGLNQNTEILPMISYENIRSSVHSPYTSQELVRADVDFNANKLSIKKTFFGGDSYVSLVSFTTSAYTMPYLVSDKGYSINTTQRVIRTLVMETFHNWNMRHEEIGNEYSAYYPKSDPEDLMTDIGTSDVAFVAPVDRNINDLQYNTDYSKVNDLNTTLIEDVNLNQANILPTAIARSIPVGDSSNDVQWRTFLANDVYYLNNNRGEITNLEGIGNERLFIHTIDSLFITRDRTTISASETDVFLGAGDIFELQPREVLTTKDGYAGLQHPCSKLLMPIGYAFVDEKQGKIFIHDGNQLLDISAIENARFFRDYITRTEGKPFDRLSSAIVLGYDEKYDRLLFTQRKLNESFESFTASFDISAKFWKSYHDYIPHYYFSDRGNNLYSCVYSTASRSHSLFKNHGGDYGIYYFNRGNPKPMIVDVVFNHEPGQTKYFQWYEWITVTKSTTVNFDGTKLVKVDVPRLNHTFDRVAIYSEDKCSGIIPVVQKTNMYSEHNTSKAEGKWRFNKFRNIAENPRFLSGFYGDYDIVESELNPNYPWYKKGRFIDRYTVGRFIYDNKDNYTFQIVDVNAVTRKSDI